jgi:hypothetical protein
VFQTSILLSSVQEDEDYLTVKVKVLLTYLLAPWNRVLLEKLNGLQLVKRFPAFYGTRGSSPHSQAPACNMILPPETLPPGDTSGGVVYLRIVLSPEEASHT